MHRSMRRAGVFTIAADTQPAHGKNPACHATCDSVSVRYGGGGNDAARKRSEGHFAGGAPLFLGALSCTIDVFGHKTCVKAELPALLLE